jgi:ribosomal protein L17
MPFQKGHKLGKGRPKKSKNQKTIARELQQKLFEEHLLQEILKEKEPIIKAMIKEAKKGNVKAGQEIFNRVIGKVIEKIEQDVNIQERERTQKIIDSAFKKLENDK